MQNNIREAVDTVFGYFVVATLFLYSTVLHYSDEIMTLGGLLLLGCRLYVDGKRAVTTWRERHGGDRK